MPELKSELVDSQLKLAIQKMRANEYARKGRKPVFVRGKDGNGELTIAIPGSEEAGYKRINGQLEKQ